MSVGKPVASKVWQRHLGYSDDDYYVNPNNVAENTDDIVYHQLTRHMFPVTRIASQIAREMREQL